MKKCIVIVNPKSGRGFNEKLKEKILEMLNNYEYEGKIILTEYKKHAEKIVFNLENDIDLVISVGGDGTFSEVMNGNLKREKPFVLSHLSVGTTNDIGHMYGLTNNLLNNLKLIITGVVKDIDVCMINDRAFTYVASYGKFMDIPYKTPQELKKKLGYFAYFLEVLKQVFNIIPKHKITFEIDNIKHQGKYTFIIISNANRIAGIDNFYNDIKLDDDMFEVMLCSLNKKVDILKAFYTLKTSDVKYVSGIELYKTNNLKITFHDKDKPWCIDGEEYDSKRKTYQIKLKKNVKILIPSKNIENLFVNQ